MNASHYLLLYIDSPATSANFYSRLLEKPPIEPSPTFALFVLDSGLKLGLWSRHTVKPAAQAAGGGSELAFSVADNQNAKRDKVDEFKSDRINRRSRRIDKNTARRKSGFCAEKTSLAERRLVVKVVTPPATPRHTMSPLRLLPSRPDRVHG